jgi:hypothetical protein
LVSTEDTSRDHFGITSHSSYASHHDSCGPFGNLASSHELDSAGLILGTTW